MLANGVEVVDAAEAAVPEHQGAALQHPLTALLDGGASQPCAGGAEPGRHHAPDGELAGEEEELAFSGRTVTDDKQVRLAAHGILLRSSIRYTPDKDQEEAQLHKVEAVEVRTDTTHEEVPP